VSLASPDGPAALIVEGDGGVGKSSFLDALVNEAYLKGVQPFGSNGRLHEAPYSLCRAILRQALELLGDPLAHQLEASVAQLLEAPATGSVRSQPSDRASERLVAPEQLRLGRARGLSSLPYSGRGGRRRQRRR
jgi:GTPase SAR1 family protein